MVDPKPPTTCRLTSATATEIDRYDGDPLGADDVAIRIVDMPSASSVSTPVVFVPGG